MPPVKSSVRIIGFAHVPPKRSAALRQWSRPLVITGAANCLVHPSDLENLAKQFHSQRSNQVAAFCSVQDLILASIIHHGNRATLREVWWMTRRGGLTAISVPPPVIITALAHTDLQRVHPAWSHRLLTLQGQPYDYPKRSLEVANPTRPLHQPPIYAMPRRCRHVDHGTQHDQCAPQDVHCHPGRQRRWLGHSHCTPAAPHACPQAQCGASGGSNDGHHGARACQTQTQQLLPRPCVLQQLGCPLTTGVCTGGDVPCCGVAGRAGWDDDSACDEGIMTPCACLPHTGIPK